MKEVYFVRHAKSSWDDQSLSDHDRGLIERGVNDAELISRILANSGVIINGAFSSDAIRALKTADIFARNLNTNHIQASRDLYLAGTFSIIHFLYNLDDSYHSILVFGHNPGFTDLFNHYSKSPIDNVPTSGAFHIRYEIDKWKDVKTARGSLLNTWFPKDFR
ncbi:MAG TPA: histidine phosphatase family protein [Saprospirales bacterium]|nr:histidine phosphatase family protein [Saprospirales bacterium]